MCVCGYVCVCVCVCVYVCVCVWEVWVYVFPNYYFRVLKHFCLQLCLGSLSSKQLNCVFLLV